MARPRVPHHLKPVPTTISLAVHHRRWMDDGGLSPSAVVNRLLDQHRADQDALNERRTDRQRLADLDHILRTEPVRFAAELAALLREGLDLPEHVRATLHRLTAPAEAPEAPEAPEAVPEAPEAVPARCTWLVHNGRRQCKRKAEAGFNGLCTQHHRINEHVDMSEGF